MMFFVMLWCCSFLPYTLVVLAHFYVVPEAVMFPNHGEGLFLKDQVPRAMLNL